MIEAIANQSWVERLGWTLLHFLWQGSLVAVVYAAVRRTLSRPGHRYLLACGALASMMAAPAVTWGVLGSPDAVPDPAYRIHGTPPRAGEGATPAIVAPLPESVRATVSTVAQPRFLNWVVMVWLAGALAVWIRLAGGWVMSARMRTVTVRSAPPEWQARLAQLGAALRLSRPVRLLVSAAVQAPVVVGWLRPVVLVPVGAISGLPAGHLEALLLHELAHIRRHDYFVNLLQSVAEATLFYHPAVWWVSGHLRSEREMCCDDIAVAASGDAFAYAQALAELEGFRPAHFAAVAANGGSLSARIARLLGKTQPSAGFGPGVLALAVLLGAGTYGLFAQSEAQPAFQAASVKHHAAGERRAMIVRVEAGGRLHTQDAPLVLLIQNAYRIQSFQIVGGPSWMEDDGFDIDAKPESATDESHAWLMLRTLLADRFHLAVHRDTKEFPVWALTPASGGMTLPPAKGGGCVSAEPGAPAPPPPARGALPNIPCGSVRVGGSQAGLRRMEGQLVPMDKFIRTLSMVMGRPVLNRTNFEGSLDVQLDFTPDDSTLGLIGMGGPRDPGGAARPETDPNQPNIFAALQHQLGLKLTSTKGPVEVLVIDHAERPSEN